MNKKLIRKEKKLFKTNLLNKVKSKGPIKYEFAFYRIIYIFILSFFISFIIFTGFVYFQLKYFISPSIKSLRNEVVSSYISSDKFDIIDNKIRKYLKQKNIEIENFDYKVCNEKTKVQVDGDRIYLCLGKEALVYNIRIIKNTNIVFLRELEYYIYTSVLTAFFLTLLLYSASKRTFRKISGTYTNKEILPIINSIIDELNNMFLSYNLENFDRKLNKLYTYAELFLKNNSQNYYILESKIKKLMDNARYHYLSNQARQIFLMSKELELKYYILTRQYTHIITNYFLLLSSRHFTSAYQLFLFLIFFTIFSWILLKTLYEIPRNIDETFLFYITQAFNIISNLWWELEFKTNIEYIYSIYLQTAGVIYMGILVWIVNKEIK